MDKIQIERFRIAVMSISLLQTKLITPPITNLQVNRLKLEAQLTKVLNPNYNLALICAPAGFGKTTLVSHWLLMQKYPSAWFSLDEGDNEPLRFWSYILATLNKLQANIATEAQEVLKASQEYKAMLTILLNNLVTLESPVIMVLDDYHLISNEELHEGVSFLLEHLPKHLKLILISRSEPPLPLGRLRVRQQLLELGMPELSFTVIEATDFLNNVMNLDLSTKDVQTLAERTEGWIASLQLAALSLQREESPRDFIKAFTGSDKYILDYLAQEVLARQDVVMQDFLLQTSVLKCLSNSLCKFVTGFDNANELLLQASQDNLFLIPLDNVRQWYRYHHLFAEFLQQRLRESRPEFLPELNSRASLWFENQGLIDNAVQHVLTGGDMERAVELLETHGKHMLWQRDERPTLRYWLDSLPQEVTRASPRLCLDYAWLYFIGQDAENWLQDAERLLSKGEAAQNMLMRGEIAILRAENATHQGETSLALDFLKQGLQLIPPNEVHMRGFALQSKGYVFRVRGEVIEAEKILREACQLCNAASNFVGEVAAFTDLAEVYKLQGYLSKAKQTFNQALEIANKNRSQLAHIACVTLVGLANILYEQNYLDEAFQHAQKGLKLAKQAEHNHTETYAYLTLAKLLRAQGDTKAFDEYIQFTANSIKNDFSGRVEAQLMRFRLEKGHLTVASQWANKFVGNNHHEQILLVVARIRSAEGNAEESLSCLKHLLLAAEKDHRKGRIIEICVLQALVFAKHGNNEQALKALQKALILAENEKYARVFVDEGDTIYKLLQKALSHDITPIYTSTLLKAFASSNVTQQSSLNSLLTQRELEILKYIANGLSNKEIAKKLIRSLGTIKVHTSNIYSKLGAKNRTEAVARARALNLL